MSRRKVVFRNRGTDRKLWYYPWKIANSAFHDEMLPILQALEDERVSPKVKSSLKKYLIISQVTTIECVLWNLAVINIDKHAASIGELVDGSVTIPINEFSSIAKGKLTKGKIIAMSYNFTNPEDMRIFFSRVLKIPIFEVIKAMDKDDPYNFVKKAANLNRNWNNFIEMFELRDRIVHQQESVKLTLSQVKSLVNCTMNFLEAFVFVGNLEFKNVVEKEVVELKRKGLLASK